jgi:hypothetical protein
MIIYMVISEVRNKVTHTPSPLGEPRFLLIRYAEISIVLEVRRSIMIAGKVDTSVP